jgi:hypothetical protein
MGRGYQRGRRGGCSCSQRQVSDAVRQMANAAITPTLAIIISDACGNRQIYPDTNGDRPLHVPPDCVVGEPSASTGEDASS